MGLRAADPRGFLESADRPASAPSPRGASWIFRLSDTNAGTVWFSQRKGSLESRPRHRPPHWPPASRPCPSTSGHPGRSSGPAEGQEERPGTVRGLPLTAALRGVPTPYNAAEEAGEGGVGGPRDSVLQPWSHGDARGAVAWPCLPVAFQDFLCFLPVGQLLRSPHPHPGQSRFPSLEGQQASTVTPPFPSSSLNLLFVPSCLFSCPSWGPLPRDSAARSAEPQAQPLLSS